ncbi:MAG TPA: HDOD domain-containing protein [Candidatus Hydrogenedentes bacterium]|nr:HDOD domain-containing protein [Candidatus Hydrogenedentota bacterium]
MASPDQGQERGVGTVGVQTGKNGRKRIGELLIEEGLITAGQLQEALAVQQEKGGKVVENLIALNYLDARSFLTFLSRQPGMASIDLLNYTIPRELIELVPAAFALKHEVVPLDKMGRDLTVGMACPLDAASIAELEQTTGLRVRPLLVSMNDVRVALERYYAKPKVVSPLAYTESLVEQARVAAPVSAPRPVTLSRVETAISLEGIMHLVRNVKGLPALPETVHRVRAMIDRPETSTRDIAEVVEQDPSLSAKLLSLANSSAYGFAHRVENVTKAVTLLGLRETYSVVLTSAVIDYFDASKHFDYKAYWRWSVFCATAARTIAEACRHRDAGTAFSAGLLHDLGRLVFAEVIPERYAAIDQTLPDREVIALEERHFGVSHPEIGYLLALEWALPGEIMTAMRFHHQPVQADACHELVATVGLAAVMTDAYGRITKENVRTFAEQCKDILHLLRITDKDFILILGETAKAAKQRLQDWKL